MNPTINSFDKLITFFKENDLTCEQMTEITGKGLKLYFIETGYTKEQFIKCLTEYWEKWKDTNEKPFLIDLTDPLE